MEPDDVVLVALVKSPRDLERVKSECWYRVPVRHAPRHFAGAQYLALYLTRAFGECKWSIREYAEVRGHELVRRKDLIPEEVDHARAEELYYKLELGDVQTLPEPILSRKGRRLVFVWTTGEKFSRAREINDLLGRSAADDAVWEELKSAGVEAERQILVREGRARYRVDFLIECPAGQLAVVLGPSSPLRGRQGLRTLALNLKEDEIEVAEAVERIRRMARELGLLYPTHTKEI